MTAVPKWSKLAIASFILSVFSAATGLLSFLLYFFMPLPSSYGIQKISPEWTVPLAEYLEEAFLITPWAAVVAVMLGVLGYWRCRKRTHRGMWLSISSIVVAVFALILYGFVFLSLSVGASIIRLL